MPCSTFVYIIGKHINIVVKTTTLEDLNQTRANIIMDMTGVAFITTIKGSRSSSINLISPEAIPASIPMLIDKSSPIKTLNILLKTLLQK